MPGTFFGINTALRGRGAAQTPKDVRSHNISNVSTPGYSRQIADLQTTDPLDNPVMPPGGVGELGSGVTVASVTRAHDDFIQQQIVYQNGVQAQQQTLSDTLSGVGQVYNDPSSQGFSTLLSNFFTSWQQLANNPSDNASRVAVVGRATNLAAGFNAAASSLQEMQGNADKQVGGFVQQINTITGQIADLNKQIAVVTATGQQPNDLADTRDTLITTLSSLANITYNKDANGMVSVSLAGAGPIVSGITTTKLATAPNGANPGFSDVVFEGQTTRLSIGGGQLGGALYARDRTLTDQLSQLRGLAQNVMSAVNTIHQGGYDKNGAAGQAFFTLTPDSKMQVNPTIAGDPSLVAAGKTANSPEDGDNASAIARLQESPASASGQTVTLQAQYAGMISALGVAGQQALSNVRTGGLVLQHLNAQQSSVSSVSLNEEASNLLRYQHAYEAAARVISIMDQTIGDMIQKLGG